MKKGGVGGHLTKTGLIFEKVAGSALTITKNNNVLAKNKTLGTLYSKHELYKLLENKGIDYKIIISKKLLPDVALFLKNSKTFIIFEIKYQEVEGSTDEKLQTCDFKIKQYRKLLTNTLGYKVRYVYVLNDWFKKECYKDVLDYIKSIPGCDYIYNKITPEYLNIK